MTIYAQAAYNSKEQLKSFSYEPTPLGPLDVTITITHCGICHSDIHLIDNDWGLSGYPLVPGHEIVGIVSQCGSLVSTLKPGMRVGVGWQRGACQNCRECATGNDNLCPQQQATCIGHHGGFATAIQVDSRYAIPIPDSLDSAAAAPLLCAGITVYSPLRRFGISGPARVGVVGIGGLGHLALQFANALGCEVTALSTSPEKEQEAKRFGAHCFLPLGDITAHPGTFDFILSTVFAPLNWSTVLDLLAPNGTLCFVGAVAEPLSFPVFSLIGGQKTVCGSAIGSRQGIAEMLTFAANHQIEAQVEVLPLAEVNTAISKLRENRARYRLVLEM